MNPTREELLFQLALSKPAAKLAAWLDAECNGDSALRQRVESLLAAHDGKDSLLAEPSAPKGPAGTIKLNIGDDDDAAVGSTIGRYKLLEKLGEGGCGVVYVAEQTEPVRRRVALKVIKLGMDSKAVVARFEAERQALAMMDHPNISKVLDAGTTGSAESQISNLKSQIPGGRPYFVMELVRGIRITDYCEQNQLNAKERLDLFIKVCHAIQHAHQKGIIHRDIKPGNILVTMHDGVPVPKVIDFGIAKATEGRLTDATVYTQLHQFVGTPAYMSPEQAEMSGLDIDTRSDIYSLGVLLYELLVGSTPFDGKELIASGIDAMRKTIREKDPVRPSTRLSQTLVAPGEKRLQSKSETDVDARRLIQIKETITLLKGDLDWIVMKCIEKDRTRRYETANGLAMDLTRHLNNETVVARPPSTAYRFQKAWRRNRLAFNAGFAVLTALVIGTLVSTWQAVRALEAEKDQTRLRQVAERARLGEAAQLQEAKAAHASERQLRKWTQLDAYAADMKAVQAAIEQNNRGQAAALLNRYLPHRGEDDLRGIEWRYLWRSVLSDESHVLRHPSMVVGASISPDSRVVVTACYDGFLRLWDVSSRHLITQINRGIRGNHLVSSFRFSPDGRTLISAAANGFVVLDTATWHEIRRLDDSAGNTQVALAFSSDGRLFATASPGGIKVWETTDWQSQMIDHSCDPHTLAFGPDGRTLLISDGGVLRLWDISNLVEVPSKQPEAAQDLVSFALTADASRLAVTRWNGQVEMHSFQTGKMVWSHRLHHAAAISSAFSPDMKILATGSFDQTIQLLDAVTGELRQTLLGHFNEIWTVEFSQDGRWLISSGKDGTARLWDLQRVQRPRQWWLPGDISGVLGFAEDGAQPVTRTAKGIVQFWNGTNIARTFGTERGAIGDTRLSADGRRLLVQTGDHAVATYSQTGSNLGEFAISNRFESFEGVSPDNHWISVRTIMADGTRASEVIDGISGKIIARFADASTNSLSFNPISFSHNGRLAAYATTNLEVKVWDLMANRLAHSLTGHVWHVNTTAFSPDDRYLASCSFDGDIRVWDAHSGKLAVEPLRGHGSGVTALAFSPDGKTLISAGDDNTIRFWHVLTGREMLVINQANTYSGYLLSPSGENLILLDTAREALRVEHIPSLIEIAMEEAGRGSEIPTQF